MSPSPNSSLKAWHKPLQQPRTWGGEAPIYRARDSTLHWVDPLISPPELHILKLDPGSGDAVGTARVLKLEANEKTGKLEVVKEIIPDELKGERRFNDGGVDAKVSYGLGGLPSDYGPPKGRLWRYDPDDSLHLMDSGVVCGNGIGWSPDKTTSMFEIPISFHENPISVLLTSISKPSLMIIIQNKVYFNDSVGQKTFAYDFDLESGSLTNRRLFLDFSGTEGEPDGLVIELVSLIFSCIFGELTPDIKAKPEIFGWPFTVVTAREIERGEMFSESYDVPNMGRYQDVDGRKGLPKNQFAG
ncbi:hypothetical protein G7Y89_g5152 [Cudoniella acicularis]|uniref:SMP-30/Gluconolactonase/LRE-like region domain-containing protein n=1 Tax=Cudoniella acicularis TaxID=354080 RepID=A0A8H4RPD4_9HELO|nr:hypothetical protein G7Y89_g5152 [Cudoniella acicularis]